MIKHAKMLLVISTIIGFSQSFLMAQPQNGKVRVRTDANGKSVVEMDTYIPNDNGKMAAPEAVKKQIPLSVQKGIKIKTDISLGPVNVDSIKAEEVKEYQNEKASGRITGKAEQVGVVRILSERLGHSKDAKLKGTINVLSDGTTLWLGKIQAAKAERIRIKFSNVILPKGVSITIYNDDNKEEIQGPYDATFLKQRTEFWSNTIFGSAVSIECSVPVGTDLKDVSFDVSAMGHFYAKLDKSDGDEGPCHNDVTCFPNWSAEARAVVAISTISHGTGFLDCTGSRINDATNNGDYMLTANHCEIDDANDEFVEVYWFFQTTSCNGVHQSLVNVPRTLGTTLLAHGSSTNYNDFSFVRLNQAPPANAAALGWTTEAPVIGENVTCIHHPRGAHKRITFGTCGGDGGGVYYSAIHHTIAKWHTNPTAPENRACTEPSSSGSPLLNANNLIIGQLHGGPSACGVPDASLEDYYGKFIYSYPIIQNWLLGGIAFYNNSSANKRMVNDQSGAMYLNSTVTNGTLTGLIIKNNTSGASISGNGELVTPNLSEHQNAWLDVESNLVGGLVLRNPNGQAIMQIASNGNVRIRNYRLENIAY